MVHGARLGVGAAAVEQLDQLARAVLELGEPLAKVGHDHRGRREGELGAVAPGHGPHVVLDRAQEDVERALSVALDGLVRGRGRVRAMARVRVRVRIRVRVRVRVRIRVIEVSDCTVSLAVSVAD